MNIFPYDRMTGAPMRKKKYLRTVEPVPDKSNEYQVSIKIEFNEMDDISARTEARKIINKINNTLGSPTGAKLQRIHRDKPPEGIEL